VYGLSVLMAFIEELRPVRRPPAFKSIPMVVGYVLRSWFMQTVRNFVNFSFAER